MTPRVAPVPSSGNGWDRAAAAEQALGLVEAIRCDLLDLERLLRAVRDDPTGLASDLRLARARLIASRENEAWFALEGSLRRASRGVAARTAGAGGGDATGI
jgi:hypothetical protein